MENFERALLENRKKWHRHMDSNVPLQYHYPEQPLRYWLRHWAGRHPEKPYIITRQQEIISYRQANEAANRLANALLELGVEKGDRVAVAAPPCAEYILAFQALLKIGAIEVPTNDRYTTAEIQARVMDSGAKMVIAPVAMLPALVPVLLDRKSPLQKAVLFGEEKLPEFCPQYEIHSLQQLMEKASPTEPEVDVSLEDPARLQYTGGTTGTYKGCVLTNRMLSVQSVLTAMWYTSAYQIVKQEDIRTLCAIPLTHIYGFNANINICMSTGGTIVIAPSTKAEEILWAVEEYRPTLFATVPKMLMDLLDCDAIEKADLSSIKGIFCGSAPLPVKVIEAFERITGGIIAEGYGMSEAACTVTANPLCSLRKPGSCGIARPDTDVLIVDMEEGVTPLPAGETGEIIIRGPTVIKEYWNNPVETARAIRGGWLYTGDIGRMDEDGYLYINDRQKDVINCSGFKVYPREVEEVIGAIPQVARVCVVGVPAKKRGETVKAFVEVRHGEILDKNNIISWCKQRLAPYKIPRAIQFVDRIPLTSVGKIDRKQLRKIG